MNEYENLIFIKGKEQTGKVNSCVFQEGKCQIQFTSSFQSYSYWPNNVRWYKSPQEIDARAFQVEVAGEIIFGATKIFIFNNQYVCTFSAKGYKRCFPINEVHFLKSCLCESQSAQIFDYLKSIAKATSLYTEDGKNILANHYAKIDFLRDDCILADYLHPGKKTLELPTLQVPIYPFGFNLSQKMAVENALNSRLSIIEGPPGTGKTQTILNILANAMMNGQSVCVASCNNSAMANIEEKLKKYQVDFIAAFLGSSDNRKNFIDAQKVIPNEIERWRLSIEENQNILGEMANMMGELNQMLAIQTRVSELRRQLGALETERAYYNDYAEDHEKTSVRLRGRLSPENLLRLWVEIETYAESGRSPSWWYKLRRLIHYGMPFSTFNNSTEELIFEIQKQYYQKKIQAIQSELDILEGKLSRYNFDAKMKQYSALSLQVFRSKLEEKYRLSPRHTYTLDDLWKQEKNFVKDYPIILSTTYSATSGFHNLFDYLIMDESSQVDIATGALALSGSKRTVIVGDLVQLPNVVTDETAKITDAIYLEHRMADPYRYAHHSLLSSVIQLFPNAPRTLLREHYRCHPKIIEFCNQKFYHGELIVLTKEKGSRPPLMVYKTVKGNHARGHLNQRQIDVIFDEIVAEQHLNTSDDSVGIIAPYRPQADALQARAQGTDLEADTVHKFQGREKDTIIFSSVDNEITTFADDANLINVAVSRAENQFILVVPTCNSYGHTNTGDLIHYIEYNNFEVLNSRIYSIFDYLYKEYTEMRMHMLKRIRKISNQDSENLMYSILLSILEQDAFSKLDVVCHTALKTLIRDTTLLDEREIAYVRHPKTHVDFLVFDKLSHQPVLVIEVDGYEYHKEGTAQAQRDECKDRILGKYDIPILRLKTNGSQERERIIRRLMEILGL